MTQHSPLDLAVGDLVVYASHGIGRIDAASDDTVTLVFESGLKVTLPLDRALGALRPIAGAAELEDVRRTLNADVPPATEPWARRHRTIQDTVAAGHATGLAEIVREGIQRERSAANAGGKPSGPSERELYLRARKLLAAEVAASRGIDADAADAWIVEQIGPAQT